MRELKQDWRDIFQGFKIALDPKKMLMGFVWAYFAIIFAFIVLWLLPAEVAQPAERALGTCVSEPVKTGATVVKWCGAVVEGRVSLVEQLTQWRSSACAWLGAFTWKSALSTAGLGLVYAALMLILWALLGGPILRMCAVQFLRDETIPFAEASEFARKKRWSFFWAPLTPFIVAAILCIPIVVLGAIGQIPWLGPLIVAIFFIFAILTGLFIVLVLIGGVFGMGLMGPTIAVEGTDSFDAIARSFGYVYQRPWRFIWYYLVAGAYGFVVTVFVAVVAYLTFMVPAWLCCWAMGAKFGPVMDLLNNWHFQGEVEWGLVKFAAWVIKILAVFVAGLVLGFMVSYCCAVHTIIYALLRRAVDGTEMNEIYMEEEEEDFSAFEATPPSEAAAEAAEKKPEEERAEEKAEESAEKESEEAEAAEEKEPEEEASKTKKKKKKAKKSKRKRPKRRKK